jgi:hypothetical protein
MTDTFRTMCAELLRSLENYPVQPPRDRDLCARARALLALPVAEGPTDDELHDLWMDSMDLGEARNAFAFTRAALAKWGRPTPQPPADGEVAQLVEWLTTLRDHDLRHVAPYSHPSIAHWHDFLTRAAELLERPTPQPVAVSERLPEPDDCDEQGRCWVFDDQLGLPSWTLIRVQGGSLAPDMYWLPANALPTPEGG